MNKLSNYEVKKDRNIHYIPWENVKEVMDEETHAKFIDFMMGQTAYIDGVYLHDFERFLNMLK